MAVEPGRTVLTSATAQAWYAAHSSRYRSKEQKRVATQTPVMHSKAVSSSEITHMDLEDASHTMLPPAMYERRKNSFAGIEAPNRNGKGDKMFSGIHKIAALRARTQRNSRAAVLGRVGCQVWYSDAQAAASSKVRPPKATHTRAMGTMQAAWKPLAMRARSALAIFIREAPFYLLPVLGFEGFDV